MHTPTVDIAIDDRVFNPAYLDYLFDRTRFLHLMGGTGSGKSTFVAQMIVLRMMIEPGHKYLFCRKVQRNIRRSQFAEVTSVIRRWNVAHLFDVVTSRLEITCKLNGNMIVCEGLDDPEKLKSIEGITDAWIEEATEMYKDDFQELNRRARQDSPYPNQIIFTYNPIHYYHWINKEFHQGSVYRDRTHILKTTYKDNLFLRPEQVREIEDLRFIDPMQYNIYALGEWSPPRNIVYNFTTCDVSQVQGKEKAYGIDFGFRVPTTVAEVTFNPEAKEVYWHEMFYESEVTNADLIEWLKEESGIPPKAYIYADSAEPDRIEEIRRAGFNIHPAKKAVTSGIDYCKRFRIHVTDQSPNAIRELSTYKYKEDKNGQVFDEPVKLHDHFPDAARYATLTHGMRFISSRKSKPGTPSKPIEFSSIAGGRGKESRRILKGYK